MKSENGTRQLPNKRPNYYKLKLKDKFCSKYIPCLIGLLPTNDIQLLCALEMAGKAT